MLGWLRDLLGISFVIIGGFLALLGIMFAGLVFRNNGDIRGMFVGIGITILGVASVVIGCWILTLKTPIEKMELEKEYKRMQQREFTGQKWK